ncbi:multidrug effflux MFS transporter [Belnapia rosea]|uniref:multidrug effflux MFS transporter n=1 Tax=Belnapia rosea TaxID=938405 RepID=UPI000882591F|nr:multidrug effflux MFS transporter [Belnapia rosea]SDB18305.1 MFS transporter, DHA1 family, bicyclomycin/chloramphenicol resistance protein [Belnapia rosea]
MPPVSAFLVLILAAMSAFGPLATDMYLPAFPAIAAGLRTDAATVQKTLAAFFAGMAIAQLAFGPLSDRFGRRPPLLAGLGIFVLGSIGCALTGDAGWLSVWRFVQGLGGCAGMVTARAILRDVTEGTATIRLMSRLMLVVTLAPILAPSIGGLLLGWGGWRAIFWALVAYGLGLALVVTLTLPETLAPERRRREGLVGIVTVYARMLGNRRFMGLVLSGVLPMGGLFAYIAGSPFVFMELHGVAPAHYGLVFGANALGIMGVSQLNAMLSQRHPPERVLLWGLLAMAGAGVVLAALSGSGSFLGVALPLFVYVASIGMVMPIAAALAMASQGRAAGSASALIGTLQFSGGALTGALVGALHDGTAVPMAVVMGVAGVGGLLFRLLLVR